MRLSSTRIVPSSAISTSIGSMSRGFSSGVSTLGSSIAAPSLIAGATTMKMMSSTSTTSTSGVTLMSGVLCCLFFALRVVTAMVILHLVQKLAERAGERDLHPGHARVQVVEQYDGWNRDHQTERRFHERLCNAGRNCGDATGARRADALERRDDADHRAEQP